MDETSSFTAWEDLIDDYTLVIPFKSINSHRSDHVLVDSTPVDPALVSTGWMFQFWT